RKPEAGADSDRFGGEERFENLRPQVRGNAGSAVLGLEQDAMGLLQSAQGELAGLGRASHRLEGVVDKDDQDLLDLVGAGADLGQLRVQLQCQFDLCVTKIRL